MKERKQMGRVKQTLICLAATLVVGLSYFYFELPALNFHSPAFYTFIFNPVRSILCHCRLYRSLGLAAEERQPLQVSGFREFFAMMKRHCMIPFFSVPCADCFILGRVVVFECDSSRGLLHETAHSRGRRFYF